MRPPIACCHRVAFLAGLMLLVVTCTAAEAEDGFLAWLRDTSPLRAADGPGIPAPLVERLPPLAPGRAQVLLTGLVRGFAATRCRRYLALSTMVDGEDIFP